MVAHPRPPTAGPASGYRLRLSDAARDPAWDRFLLAATGGHHLQSSYWGAVKGILGWRAVRVVAVDAAGEIRGGTAAASRPPGRPKGP